MAEGLTIVSSGRRDFLKASAVLGGALGVDLLSMSMVEPSATAKAPKPLRILILGGTGFIGPATKFTVRQMLEGIRDTVTSNATFTYTTSAFLRAQQPPVRGWSDLPVWIAPEGAYAGFTQRSIAKALSKGLTFRPYADTVRETIAFYKAQTPERQAALRGGSRPSARKRCSPPGT